MKAVIRHNGRPLRGRIWINGSKNASLPIMAACLMTSETVTLRNVPNISDVRMMMSCLTDLGASVTLQLNPAYAANHTLLINCEKVSSGQVSSSGAQFRASFTLLGPLLTRFGCVTIPLPGGCTIGQRSIDRHLKGFARLGVTFSMGDSKGETVIAMVPGGQLRGEVVTFTERSVGATENLLMAAVLANGKTIIRNAAMEPDVIDLAHFLVQCGAKISGIGMSELRIEGVEALCGCEYAIGPDRHEAGTYALAAIMTNGSLELYNIQKAHLLPIQSELEKVGGKIIEKRDHLVVMREENSEWDSVIGPPQILIETNPYPGFPTDMQPCFCTALCYSNELKSSSSAYSVVIENIFERRLRHCEELKKLGAQMSIIEQQEVRIWRSRALIGGRVEASDLRAAAALILAGLVAHGETVVYGMEHLLRGYEAMDAKLKDCGASIEIIPAEDASHPLPQIE